MQYNNVVNGKFLQRPNRFIAYVEIDGKIEICHVKNTGRCQELLQYGVSVWCAIVDNPTRKTKFDLIAVQKDTLLINMDSQAPNHAVAEWITDGGMGEIDLLKAEQRYRNSRFDFYLEKKGMPMFLEVKGVTLESNGICRFPDAPTSRGTRHIHELISAKKEGYDVALLFVIQMSPVSYFEPNDLTDPSFGSALREAAQAGVSISAWDCLVTYNSIKIKSPVDIKL